MILNLSAVWDRCEKRGALCSALIRWFCTIARCRPVQTRLARKDGKMHTAGYRHQRVNTPRITAYRRIRSDVLKSGTLYGNRTGHYLIPTIYSLERTIENYNDRSYGDLRY